MERTPFLPLPEGMFIEKREERETSLILEVIATQETACCPLCSPASSSVHSHYHRTLADVPCSGRQLQLSLTVRKFFCRHPLCLRKVFDLSASNLRPAVGENDDSARSRLTIHRIGDVWKRRKPTGSPLSDAVDTSDDPASHYGFATALQMLCPTLRHR
jgi:transposase